MSPFPLIDKLMKYFENFSSLITDSKISREDFEIKNKENNFNIINENNNNNINKVKNLNNNNCY
jgi:hypothetical protein